jgi:hypothetical protein
MTSRIRWSRWVLILLLPIVASSAVTAATTSENFRLKGETLMATFEAFDPLDPCLLNFVAVTAADTIEKTSPGGKKTIRNGIVLVVIQRDVCTDSVLFDGMGIATNQTFQVAGNLSSATLTAQVQVFEGEVGFPFQVNLTWTATGKAELLHSKETFRDAELGIRILSQSVSSIAPATASGTVFGLGQNFTPEASDTGSIQTQNDGSLLIQKTL